MKTNNSSRIQKKIAVSIPRTPNFIQVGDHWIPVQNFTDNELKEIAKEWTIKLLHKANKIK